VALTIINSIPIRIHAANNQEIDGAVKVLRQKDETKNEKKITETEIETKFSELFSDFQTVRVFY